MGRVSTLVMFVTTVGCSNGWPSLDEAAAKDCVNVRASVERVNRYGPTTTGDWEQQCIASMVAAMKPCTEYKFGSDSAMECLDRRALPERQAIGANLQRAETQAFFALKEKVSGRPDKDREAWCSDASRSSAEKAVCADVAKDVAIEHEMKAPNAKKKDPLLGVQF